MPVDIDGFAVLGAIARHPEVFPAARGEAAKLARTLVGKQVKDRALTLAALRTLAGAVAFETFDLIADAMSDAEVKSLLGKVDKHNAALKAAPPQEQRRHLAGLARGAVMAAEKASTAKPTKAAKTPPAKTPEIERSGNSKAMKATRKVGRAP